MSAKSISGDGGNIYVEEETRFITILRIDKTGTGQVPLVEQELFTRS